MRGKGNNEGIQAVKAAENLLHKYKGKVYSIKDYSNADGQEVMLNKVLSRRMFLAKIAGVAGIEAFGGGAGMVTSGLVNGKEAKNAAIQRRSEYMSEINQQLPKSEEDNSLTSDGEGVLVMRRGFDYTSELKEEMDKRAVDKTMVFGGGFILAGAVISLLGFGKWFETYKEVRQNRRDFIKGLVGK